MTTILPRPGSPVDDIETPALVIDLSVLERNLETMHAFFRRRPAKVRSVTKGHKCPAIAQRQMVADGAILGGLCCAKISEAEVMVEAGARSVRMIEQVVGRPKVERLVALARHAHLIALVDDPRNADELAEAAAAYDMTLDVLIEVEIGLNRCGVAPGRPAVDLARHVMGKNSLRFAGLSAHEGSIMIADPEARCAKTRERVQRLLDARQDVEKERIPVEICGAGSTTTWNIAGDMTGITEIDPGGYALMDLGLKESIPDIEFDPALKMLTTVISRPTADRAVVDCGFKAMGRAADGRWPSVEGLPGATVNRLNSEHGMLDLGAEARSLRPGDKVMLISRYYGSTVVANDHFIGVRDGKVECVWAITARGSHQ